MPSGLSMGQHGLVLAPSVRPPPRAAVCWACDDSACGVHKMRHAGDGQGRDKKRGKWHRVDETPRA